MTNITIVKMHINQLVLDKQNPRLSEFGIDNNSQEKDILEVLWDAMAVNELMYSIISNGFWDYEPLAVMRLENSNQYVVLEGNRRFAAVTLIHKPDLIGDKMPHEIRRLLSAIREIL